MKGSLCESTQWAAGLAARLRYLQSSLATELSETRERTLSKELAKALKPVAPEKRRQFLENLVAQFPVPDAFHVRCQLEAGHRQLSADKEAALKAIAERDAALEGLQSQIAAYASQLQALGEERDTLVQARERDVDSLSQIAVEKEAALQSIAERNALIEQLQAQLTAQGSQLTAQAAQLEALRQERDALALGRQEDAAKMTRMADEHRQQLASGSGETLQLLEARDQALAQIEDLRAKSEAELARAKKDREAVARERDEEAARAAALRANPLELVDCLLNVIPTATPEQIAAFVPKLQDTGLFPASGEPTGLRVPQELRERLKKIAPGRNLDPTRALRALDILIEFTWSLDQLVWQIWKGVAPKTIIHVEPGPFGDFKKCLAPYLTGDSEVSNEQLRQTVEKTRRLVAGLLAAMGNVGESCTATLRQRFAPTEIKKLADKESGLLDSVEKKCWRKFNELYIQAKGPDLEKEILNNVRKYTEKLVLGADAANVES